MRNDFISELGLLSFVTRLKRLSDQMIHDGRRLYKELGLDIEPNWFVIFKLLNVYDQLTVTEIAERIGFAHPSVISIVNKMIRGGYLEESRCGFDNRRRLLKLTPRAREKMPEFEMVWNSGVAGMKEMLADLDVLTFLDIIEARVAEKGFRERALLHIDRSTDVKVIDFDERYVGDFARLNYEWINQLFKVEAHDREMLDDPIEYIIKEGGQIFFALIGNEPVGTVALIAEKDNSFELAKMAVTAKHRGLKIGEKLMSVCLEYARSVGRQRIFLLSNRKLIPAINLYKKFGFNEIPLDPDNLYQRTDIQMELVLN